MRANRLLAVTVLSVLGVTGLTACGSDSGKKGDSAPAASAPASAAASGGAAAAPAPAAAGAPGGLEKLTVPEILKKSQAAGAKLKSVKVDFTVSSADGDLSAVLAADGSGNCAGTVTAKGKGKADLLRTGGKVWVKPDTEFLKVLVPAGGAAVTAAGGKWIAAGDSAEVAEYAAYCDLGLQIQKHVGLTDEGAPDDKGTLKGSKKVAGLDAVIINMSSDGTSTDAAIANQGEPYLLSLESKENGTMKFSDFDKPVQAAAPAGAIDLKTLLGH
ncbi:MULTISPECIES: hypothetical protein [Kitasatospora]|uniref:Putative lipoprotein n=1 Tax=Kitasatospora setae (strain ATCC 33774 / DSM 43861 / JCM 3304 / KCC A-0304 / NBRC 14216 / KM-6054) TaxID=452652 RepID=E4NC99_KITSK|nr:MULTISPECIES: hypothetical protein [Kitasatospora]BAJ28830.1 putative lipoprotein [Kitasatospora setae KM-6054]